MVDEGYAGRRRGEAAGIRAAREDLVAQLSYVAPTPCWRSRRIGRGPLSPIGGRVDESQEGAAGGVFVRKPESVLADERRHRALLDEAAPGRPA